MTLIFEWDEQKAERNLAKHGVTFTEATAVFGDPDHADVDASRPQDGEQRRKAIGLVSSRLLSVVYVMRGGAIRLISARPPNPPEERLYAHRDLRL